MKSDIAPTVVARAIERRSKETATQKFVVQLNVRKLTPTQLGLLFLIPGLIVSIPALVSGNFQGAATGFGFFATVFGGLMCLIGIASKKPV